MTPETVWKLVRTDPVPVGWVGFLVFLVSVGTYWLVRRFVTKNFWVSAGGLVLLGLGVAYQSVLFFTDPNEGIHALFALVSWVLVLSLGHRLFWGREKGLPPRRRQLLLGIIYLSLAGNVIWAWAIAHTGYFSVHELRDLGPEMRNVAAALTAYQVDNAALPPAVDRDGKVVPFQNTGFRVSSGYLPWRLTTPVAYMDRLPLDPYSARKEAGWMTYRYATDGKTQWIFASDGLDRDADIPLADYIDPRKGGRGWYEFETRPGRGNAVSYDPSNGVLTSGDIVKTDRY